MNLRLTLKLAWNNIYNNKLRSALTMLGLVIGIASVIILVGIANGAAGSVSEQISNLGADVLTVSIADGSDAVAYQELNEMTSLSSVSAVAPYLNLSATVSREGTSSSNYSLVAANGKYLDLMSYALAEGRTLSKIDVDNSSKVVIAGSGVAQDLFGLSDPIGETVKLNGDSYTVIGVLESVGSSMGNQVDDMLVLPITTAKYLGSDSGITNFYVQAADEDQADQAAAGVSRYMQQTYGLSEDDCSVSTQEAMLETMSGINNTLSLLLGGIAGISLLVGGIGVMNVMLVSVTERTKEIGIRKSLGAKRRDILKQFLLEALVLSMVGGFIGIAVGFLGGGAADLLGASFAPGAGVVVLAFSVSAAVGLIFGIFPSYRAAGLRPIDALKQE